MELLYYLVMLLGEPIPKNLIYKAFDLIHIDKKGELVLLNQKEVLNALTYHED